MRIYKTRIFARFLRKENIRDADLVEAARRANRGLIDADLGGGLIKQRVARPGQGRSGGYCCFAQVTSPCFWRALQKNERANIADDDPEDLKTIARQWLTDLKAIEKDLAAGILNEVPRDDED